MSYLHQNTEENSKKKSISSTDHKTVTISESAAGAPGTKGVFTVVKIDSKTEEKLLGATFTLQKMVSLQMKEVKQRLFLKEIKRKSAGLS